MRSEMERPRFEEHVHKSQLVEKGWERAIRVLTDSQINMRSFQGVYPPQEIDLDITRVNNIKTKFETRDNDARHEASKLATIFEAILDQQIDLDAWLGMRAVTLKASEFDDIINGVDTVVEFLEGAPDYLALAVDVTYSAEHLYHKFGRIRESIDSGTLSNVKYFQSDASDYRGPLASIPRVVIGTDAKTVYELIELWLSAADPVQKKKLRNHSVRSKILHELREQLQSFDIYAKRIGKFEAARRIEKGKRRTEGVMRANKPLPIDHPELRQDEVFREIIATARRFASL